MNNKLILYVVGGVVGLGLVIAIAVSAVSGGTDASDQFGEITIDGQALPAFEGDPANDPAAGTTAPTVTGETFDGEAVSIEADGRPKVVLFLAHWCPHCQAEVPRMVDWLEAGNKPDSVDLYGVSTLANRVRAEWPPSEWLESEGWDVPTLKDDESNSASSAYGMAGTPYWLVLDGNNQVVFRMSGEVTAGGMDFVNRMFQAAAESA